MHHAPADTIAAIATAPGRGGVGIIRLSGPEAPKIAEQIAGRLPPPRVAELRIFRDSDGDQIDEGLILNFPAPGSFTGEHVVELHAHGGPVVLDMLVARTLSLGARTARPGEFSERAFLNDKLDLAQAEAIADLIDSDTEQAARAATRSLQGEFSRHVHVLVDELTSLRVYVEAAIDFPDEEIDFLSDGQVQAQLKAVTEQLAAVQKQARQGQLLRDGMTLVIAGRPNAGKSSLLNALAGRQAAIVTDVAGTTRDVLREHIQIDGMPLHIIDTAGLRDSSDPVEQEGIRRAWHQIEQADRVLLVIDSQQGFCAEDRLILERLPPELPHTRIFSKTDLVGHTRTTDGGEEAPVISISTLSGEGMEVLRDHLKQLMGYQGTPVGGFSARRRHLDALQRAAQHLEKAAVWLENAAGELLAEELRLAQQQLSSITGEFSSDDLLGEIFSGFCIGK
ncbi:tRNA modification GTPase [Thiogranum longum]|uniref:tRNA modification GTPase MnmE n=1 Tax=Thiogranum longum TaxID=1537524 RepID=A0A4R1H9V2_9GAMM|nr:tRNA uridine-5-carboxymethylaminomethyl(34) synthesis GTPase MnmE [Thiogranum longum]TCK16900.1 tRNA modification GTPase [Thiogranum longum]